MNDTGAKQQIVDKIKGSSNILVTVSRNPSVDELSAALGLTLLLNKMNKHATAVFSGAIPPAITFLDPEKTFENTVDSLRDFIIALDKEKADHLRYKVDGDVVKIFITPYRTTISSDDLDFSQGDYNVELVLALGVKDQDDLDSALAAHGRILHDATVATMSAGDSESSLGSVDWREGSASSLSEMLVSLNDALKSDKMLLDEQIATAFLTGIVAATDRFSNNRTSSKVMTIAAQLMSAGANQQLIASKLEEAHEIGPDAPVQSESKNSDGTTDLSEGESTKLNKKQATSKKSPDNKKQEKKDDGSLTISHEKEGTLDEVAALTAAEEQEKAAQAAQEELEKRTKGTAPSDEKDQAAKAAEENLAEQLATVAPAVSGAATPSVADLQKDLAAADADVSEAATQAPTTVTPPVLSGAVTNEAWRERPPSMGGTLNATTEQAAEDERRAVEDDRNRTILSHNSGSNYVGGGTPMFQSPLNAASQPEVEAPIVDPLAAAAPTARVAEPTIPEYTAPVSPSAPASETLADLDKQNRVPHEEARAAVDAAFNGASTAPQNPIQSQPAAPTPPQSAALPDQSLPPLPPLPDFSTLPPLPPIAGETPSAPNSPPVAGALSPEKLEDIFGTPPAGTQTPPPTTPTPADPGQFKIPGQS